MNIKKISRIKSNVTNIAGRARAQSVKNLSPTSIQDSVSSSSPKQRTHKPDVPGRNEIYHAVFNSLGNGLCIIEILLDESGNPTRHVITETNPMFNKFTGIKKPVGKTLGTLIYGVERNFYELCLQVLHTGKPVKIEKKLKVRNKWFSVIVCRTDFKRTQRIGIVLTDISERVIVEDLFSMSELRYRRLFETAKDGILILNFKTRTISDANPYICKLIGYSKAELLGKELCQIGLFKDKNECQTALDELQHTAIIKYEDFPITTKAGLNINVELVSNKYKENGTWVIQCNIRDITKRKIEEQELIQAKNEAQSSKENLHNLFMNAPAMIAIVNGPDLVFEMANPEYRKFLGVTGEIDGVPLKEALPEIQSGLYDTVKAVADTGQRYVASELPILLKWAGNTKPHVKYINLIFEPIRDTNKNSIGVMCFGNDVTEHVLNRKKLEKASDAKNEFISIASHELKTPITSVKGYAQILDRRFQKTNDAESSILVKKMDAQLDKLTALVNNLLDVTKIEEGKMMLNKTYFDFSDLIEEIRGEMQLTTQRHSIKLKLGKTQIICGDRDRLGQVIINILSNAIKYSPRTNEIVIATRTKSKTFIVSIKDNGVGINKADQPKVLKRFHRAEGKDLETYPGLGLGLYICNEIIKRHNGTMSLESEKGKGSTFSFSLPLS